MSVIVEPVSLNAISAEMQTVLLGMTKGRKGYMGMYLDLGLRALRNFDKRDFTMEVFIAKQGGAILGWGMLQDLFYRDGDYLEVSLFVPENGRKAGVGRALMDHLKECFADRKLAIWVSKENRAFYGRDEFSCDPFHRFDMDRYNEKGEWVKL